MVPLLGGGVELPGVGDPGSQDPGAGANTRGTCGRWRGASHQEYLVLLPASPRRGDREAQEWSTEARSRSYCPTELTLSYPGLQQVWFGRLATRPDALEKSADLGLMDGHESQTNSLTFHPGNLGDLSLVLETGLGEERR